GQVRGGRRRHVVSRRDCGYESGAAVQDPAGGPGAGDRARGRHRHDSRRRPVDRGDQPRPQGSHQTGAVSGGPVLPAGRRPDPSAAARGARGRPPPPHCLLRPPVRRAIREADPLDLGSGARAAAQPRVGRERPRAAQRHRASGDRGHGRRAARRAPPRGVPRRRSDAPRPAGGGAAHARGSRGAPHHARADADQRADRCGGGDSRDPSQYADAEDEGVRPVTPPLPPVRVEKALALLPDVEALGPLRALLVSISRPDERALWSSSGPYLTLGKRGVQPEELRRRMPQAFHVITEHLQTLYRAYVEALECQQRGDGAGTGAQAWYARGLRLATAGGDQRQIGRLERDLGVLARHQGDSTVAGEHLRKARECFESVDAAEEMAGLLNTQGQLEAQLGRPQAASGAYREALAWLQRAPRDAGLEVSIRLNLAELHLEAGRFLDGEEEMRRAEQVAIAGNLTGRLVQIYTLMGKLRGRQLDETGFVFFEQAIELSRMLEPSPTTEAQVYLEYGLFRERLGQREEARAYLERARELYGSV